MPDVTSTLLAMYQQIIGGSSAREQASLEAECARRIITSGLTVAPGGAFTIPGNVTIGGTLSVVNFSVTGTFSVPGTLTVGTLAVTGNATVAGTLGCGPLAVTGNATVSGTLTVPTLIGPVTVTGAATVSTTLGVGGILTANADLNVGGNQAVAGALTVSGTPNAFRAAVTGSHITGFQNTQAGPTNKTRLQVGNDLDPNLCVLDSFSSTFTTASLFVANGSTLYHAGAGGLTIVTAQAAAPLRFATNSLERLRITANGEVLINTPTPVPGFNQKLGLVFDGSAGVSGMLVQNLNAANVGNLIVFQNAAGATAGYINQTAALTVNYNTASDARLKTDRGRATDLTALRGVVIHEFAWIADGTVDRGVFAQEAHVRYPRAVTPGTDATTDDGTLVHPWVTDYSKFVPDLIAGWQQHEAQIAALHARLRGAA